MSKSSTSDRCEFCEAFLGASPPRKFPPHVSLDPLNNLEPLVISKLKYLDSIINYCARIFIASRVPLPVKALDSKYNMSNS